MTQLEKINSILTKQFKSLEECLSFYQEVLPQRTAGYHQEEVGPVYHKNYPGEADKFVNKIFTLNGKTIDMSGGLNWYSAAEGDLEWNGGLVRQGYFMLLAEEYVKTGNEKYAATIIEHMTDYIDNVPRYNPDGRPYLEYKKSTWRPFEVAARIAETWPEALAKIINSKSMTAEIWAKILISINDQADFVSINHWKTGNHACLEVASLGIIGIFYSEMVEAEKWRKYSIDFLMEMWPKQFFYDGYTREMSGGYQWVAMRNFFSLYEVALRNGFEKSFPPLFKERLILTSLAELMQSKPDYSIPITNDSNTLTNRKQQLSRIVKVLDIPEIEYRITEGVKGKKPVQASYFFPEARVGFMRQDWSKNALFLFFDMGSWGENHMNEDQLNIEVSAYGRNFLVNSGRWRYTTSPDAPWMEKAKYFKTTAAYNSVLVDGYCQVSGDAKGSMKTYNDYDYAEGTFDAGYGEDETTLDEGSFKEKGIAFKKKCKVEGVTHKRQVIFVKPCFWVVRDTITGKGEHTTEQIWHYLEGEIKMDPTGEYQYTDFEDANLITKTLGNSSINKSIYKGSEQPFRGWHCPYYDDMSPAPELSFVQKGDSEIVFHTLLFPIKGKVGSLPTFEFEGNNYNVALENNSWTIQAPKEGEWILL